MSDDRTPPIMDDMWRPDSAEVLQIEDIRVSRGLTRRPASSCRHLRLRYDQQERRIWCPDCERDVEAFDAFISLVDRLKRHNQSLDRREKAIAEAEAFTIRSRAAKVMDKAWRSRTMVPACPHCRGGLLPELFTGGVSMMGKSYARARMEKKP